MKITLSLKEAESLKKVLTSFAESTGENPDDVIRSFTNELLEYGFITCVPLPVGSVTIEVDSKYIVEFMDLYDSFVAIFVKQSITLVNSVLEFQKQSEELVLKYQQMKVGEK